MRSADFGQRIGLSNMEYTNTKVQRNDDGSIVIWFSPDGKSRVRYFATGYVRKNHEGHIELHSLKKGEVWPVKGQDRLCWGIASWFGGSFYPYQPLGDVKNKRNGLCPPKHEHALLHAIDQIPKLKELLK